MKVAQTNLKKNEYDLRGRVSGELAKQNKENRARDDLDRQPNGLIHSRLKTISGEPECSLNLMQVFNHEWTRINTNGSAFTELNNLEIRVY